MGMLAGKFRPSALRQATASALAIMALAGCATHAPETITQETVTPAELTRLAIRLTPNLSETQKVSSIDVELNIPDPELQAGDTFLQMAIVRVMAPGALNNPESLKAYDDLGLLPLTIEEDPEDPSAFRQDRRWIAGRASQGNVRVDYTIEPRIITASTRPGPLIDTRTELSGFYGSGNTMLALPVEGWPRDVSLEWNLANMLPDARAASSLGHGNVSADGIVAQNLNNTFFMAGPLLSQPETGEGDFVVYWMTPAAFDLDGAARWTEQAYRYFVEFFGTNDTPFRVFMRTTERFQGGGGGGFNSFIFGTVEGEDRDPHEVRSLLAHEAIHHFVGGYGDGGGAGGQQWYSEGVTQYYTGTLPYRAGLTTLDQYIDDFNGYALSYYTNPRSNLSNAEVTRLFFSDGNAQIVPYNRGPLYIAKLDYEIRNATQGEARVDNLIFDFIEDSNRSTDGVQLWHDLVTIYLGPAGGEDFKAMMEGAPLNLPADMFGPCFRGEERMLQNYIPGFRPYEDEEGLTRAGPVAPDSNAEKAGLKRYDIIRNPDVFDQSENANPGTPVTLNILRDGKELNITYTPWSDPRPGLQWVRTDVAETECNI